MNNIQLVQNRKYVIREIFSQNDSVLMLKYFSYTVQNRTYLVHLNIIILRVEKNQIPNLTPQIITLKSTFLLSVTMCA